MRWPPRIKVAFWIDDYAPTMVQAAPVNERYTQRFLAVARENGLENPETSALVSYFDAKELLPSRSYRRLVDEGNSTALLDPWVVGHLYGYDAHTAVEQSSAR